MTASLSKFLIEKIFKNSFPMINKSGLLTVLLVIPALLIVPLNQSFYQLAQINKAGGIELMELMSMQAIMIAIHFIFTIIGIFILLLSGRLYYASVDLNEEKSGFNIMLGLILLGVVVALIFNPLATDLFNNLLPHKVVSNFR